MAATETPGTFAVSWEHDNFVENFHIKKKIM
jgi:hypothetical protein